MSDPEPSSPAVPALAGQRILVTGASGFVGRAVVARLLADGAMVSVLVRGRYHGTGVTCHRGDLRDAAALGPALAGQDSVVHLAYDMRAGGAENLAGFTRLYDAAQAAGVGRFIQASSAVVYDGWPMAAIDETALIQQPGGGPYRQAKIAMEQALMDGPMPCVILQPTLVWGPGSAFWTNRYLDVLKRGGAVVLPDPCGAAALLYVTDLAAGFAAAAALPDPGRERYLLSGPAPVPWADLMAGYRAVAGAGTVRQVPLADLRAGLEPENAMDDTAAPPLAARISARARRIIGHDRFEAMMQLVHRARGARDLHPDHHLLALYTGPGHVSTEAARTKLGWRASIDLEEGLRTLQSPD